MAAIDVMNVVIAKSVQHAQSVICVLIVVIYIIVNLCMIINK